MEFEKVTKVDLGLIKKVKQTEGSVLFFYFRKERAPNMLHWPSSHYTVYTCVY